MLFVTDRKPGSGNLTWLVPDEIPLDNIACDSVPPKDSLPGSPTSPFSDTLVNSSTGPFDEVPPTPQVATTEESSINVSKMLPLAPLEEPDT